MVTISQIGKTFGVSPMTVSNALNGRKGVSAAKARAIQEYARRNGYQPAYMARSLLRGRTNMVGLVLRGSPEDPWLAGLLHRIHRRLREAGFHLGLEIAPDGPDAERRALERFREFRVEAAVIGPLGFLDQYRALADVLQHTPYVLAFDAMEELPIDHIGLDAYAGAQMAVTHLASCGHRDIGLVGTNRGERASPDARNRHNGFRDAIRVRGLVFRREWIVVIDDPYDPIEPLLAAFLNSKQARPTAWFCHNDWHAAHAIRVLHRFGLRVPDDVSLVGFDDQPIADLMLPGITTIGYDVDLYAQRIVEMVLQGIDEQRSAAPRRRVNRWELSPRLVQRSSVRSLLP